MTPSIRCADFIKGSGQCRLKEYMPTKDDVPTIGWGWTGPDIRMAWTQAQADERFSKNLARFGADVLAALRGAPTAQGQYDAMVPLEYDTDIAGFSPSSLGRLPFEGNYPDATTQFGRWTKQAWKVLNGLTRRRAGEAHMHEAKR